MRKCTQKITIVLGRPNVHAFTKKFYQCCKEEKYKYIAQFLKINYLDYKFFSFSLLFCYGNFEMHSVYLCCYLGLAPILTTYDPRGHRWGSLTPSYFGLFSKNYVNRERADRMYKCIVNEFCIK